MIASSRIVPPSDIRSALNDLWNANETKNKIRASLFNLIFVSTKSPREEYVKKIAYNLLEKFPSRIFFISIDPSKDTPALKTSVSVISTKQGEFDITCDLIEIVVPDTDKMKVPFIILPHIIPDLPVFLVWSADPSSQDPLCDELQSFVTRIIFDSESAEDLLKFSHSVLDLQSCLAGEVADLNWARLEDWRSLISTIFSNHESLEQIKKASLLTLTFNEQETPFFCHTKIQSIYLQAWIASRLKWHKTSCEELSFTYKSTQGEDVKVLLQPVKEAKLPPGMILSLEIETYDGDHFVLVRKKETPQEISFEHSTSTVCSIPIRLQVSKGTSGHSLVNEICQKGTSEHYIDTLKLVTQELL